MAITSGARASAEPRHIAKVERDRRTVDAPPEPGPDEPPTSEPVRPKRREAPAEDDHVYSVVTGNLGLMAMPFADVCPFVNADCEPGETGLAMGIDIAGRWYDFAAGASFDFGLGLKPSEAAGDPDGTLGREHARTYLLLEGHFRYYFLPIGAWEWFAEASAGAVIINDSWSTFADREPYNGFQLVGPQAVTVSTEGVTVGAGIGGVWQITDFWLFGTRARYRNWFLPSGRQQTPVGDRASFAGRVDMFEFGAFGGFRLPL
ncbi:MAG: hypothetical protein KC731_16585 [Myxococcales bacterium]|nr:hypothetical protein [Myxococcales bacterium]